MKKYKEIEFIYRSIDPNEIQKKLKKIGATKQFDSLFESIVFDYSDFHLNKKSAWVRLRKENGVIRLSYKKRLGVIGNKLEKHTGITEIELTVSNFEDTIAFLKSIGLIIKYRQEKRRIQWIKNGVYFDIDFWPYINPILEIESSSVKKINVAAKSLDLDPNKKENINTFFLYRQAGIDLLKYKEITFKKLIKRTDYKHPNMKK